MKIIPKESIQQKLLLLGAILIVAFAIVTITEGLLRRRTALYEAAIENQYTRQALGRLLLNELNNIEKDFYRLASVDDNRDIQAFRGRIMASIEKIESVLSVLHNGGQYENVMPVNLNDTDQIKESMSFSIDEDQGYVVEVIDLRPKIMDIKQTVAELAEVADGRFNFTNNGNHAVLSQKVALILKQGDTFLLRSRESANKIFYDTNQEVQRLEHVEAAAIRRFNIVRYLIIGIVGILSISLYILIIRQIARIVAERRQANTELADYRDHLEEIVKERTGQLKDRTDQQVAVAGLGQLALSGIELSELLDAATALVSCVLDTEYSHIFEHFSDDCSLILRAGTGWPNEYIGNIVVPDGIATQCGYTLCNKAPIIIQDIAQETRFSPPKLFTEHGAVSGMCIAIPGHDQPFGVLGVYANKEQVFTEDDSHFFQSIANVLADAIQRKQAEMELETERKQLLSMFDGMDEVIYVSDPGTYEILYMNGPARKQWGNGVGQKCYKVLQGSDTPCSFCNNNHLLSENPYIREIQNNVNNRWYRAYDKAIRWSDGRVVRFELAVDITEQRRTEEELQKVQRLESIGVLAGGIAHDLNNLLTIILTNIALAKIYDTPSDKNKSVAEAERASMQMKNLAQQLLTFSKGGAPIRKRISVGDDLRRSVSFALRGSNVKSEFSISDDLWAAEVDSGQLNQVINNMVINANQAMPDGGIIRVYAENATVNEEHGLPLEPGDYIKISFADQGVGIPANHLPRIFDPFFSTKQQGNGLGLATSYSIIKKHDGHITVESEIDAGTVFHIYIPASQEKVLVQKVKSKLGPVTGDGRILIMDDEAALREAMTRIGTFLGYQVIGAVDGIEALEQYETAMKSDPFDVVIMDLTIPGGMGGKEAIQKLREMDPEAKAIVSSGYSNDPIMADFEKYGFSGVIAKPYKMQELSIEIHRVITEAA